MMKFPSASAGGTVPSGNSLAVTYPCVPGSRVGGVGRAAGAGACAYTLVIRPIMTARLNRAAFMVNPRVQSSSGGETGAIEPVPGPEPRTPNHCEDPRTPETKHHAP